MRELGSGSAHSEKLQEDLVDRSLVRTLVQEFAETSSFNCLLKIDIPQRPVPSSLPPCRGCWLPVPARVPFFRGFSVAGLMLLEELRWQNPFRGEAGPFLPCCGHGTGQGRRNHCDRNRTRNEGNRSAEMEGFRLRRRRWCALPAIPGHHTGTQLSGWVDICPWV